MRIVATSLLLLGLTGALAQEAAQGPKETVAAQAAPKSAPEPAPAQPSAGQPPAAAIAAPAADPSPDRSDGPLDKPVVCYSAREASDRVARLRLFNPLVAMQANARRLRAEPLRTRLCRSGNRLVYELALIRREGRVLRVYLNAHTGRPIASPRN